MFWFNSNSFGAAGRTLTGTDDVTPRDFKAYASGKIG